MVNVAKMWHSSPRCQFLLNYLLNLCLSLMVLDLNLRSVFFFYSVHTMSSVAKYMSKAWEENVRNLKATVETFGFHLVGRPTAA